MVSALLTALVVAGHLPPPGTPLPTCETGVLLTQPCGPAGVPPCPCVGAVAHEPYVPREGDLIFFDDKSPFWKFLYKIGGTAPPFHVGLVFKRHDGRLAILESGPDDSLHVYLFDPGWRLHQFQTTFPCGEVVIRSCKQPLDPCRSRAMTRFAEAQEGRGYAWGRLLAQGTWFRARSHPETLGSNCRERWHWMCTEIVVVAGNIGGLFPDRIKSNMTYPLDLVDDRTFGELSQTWEPARLWRPSAWVQPPDRVTSSPTNAGSGTLQPR